MIDLRREIGTALLKNRSQKRNVLDDFLKLSKVGLFLSQTALTPPREFHRFAEAQAKLLGPYLPGFPGGTVSNIRHNQFTKITRCQVIQCLIRIQQQLILNPLINWQPV